MVYTTQEAKENLPAILDEIEDLDRLIKYYLELYKVMINACIRETVDETFDGGNFTSEESVSKAYSNYIRCKTRKECLEKILKNIQKDAKNT